MKPAVYFAAGTESREQWKHYALNIPYYTHFTSPIRRYADIMVHRLLTAVLDNTIDQFNLSTSEIQKILDNCNEKKENSKQAQERGDTVYFCVFLKHQTRISEAVVMDWGDSSFQLFVPEYGVSKRVHVDDLHCQMEKKKNGFYLRPNGSSNSSSSNRGPWTCSCGWKNNERNIQCGGTSSNHGCNKARPPEIQQQQQEEKTSGGSKSNKKKNSNENNTIIGSFSGCRMMNNQIMPAHGMFVKMLTRMKVKLYHLDTIPIDFALEIQDIYSWELEKKQ